MIFATRFSVFFIIIPKTLVSPFNTPIHEVTVCGILPGNIIHLPFDGLVSEMLQFIQRNFFFIKSFLTLAAKWMRSKYMESLLMMKPVVSIIIHKLILLL